MEPSQRGTGSLRPTVGSLPDKAEALPAGTDRDLQDQVICYLSDAHLRSVETAHEFLENEEAFRAERFSRFLARRYYRDRLSRGFRYSGMLGAGIQDIVDSPQFDSILDRCVLGSLATASEVGNLAISELSSLRSELWWSELLEYERAFFLQLATSEQTRAGKFLLKNVSSVIREFRVGISELLARLKSGANVGDDFQGKATLLFSRTMHGRIYVVELDERTSATFHAIDGMRTADEIAEVCGQSREEIQRILSTLSDIGSVVLAISQGHSMF